MKRLNNAVRRRRTGDFRVTKPHAAMKRLNHPRQKNVEGHHCYKTARGYEALKQDWLINFSRREYFVTKPHAAMKRLNSVP